MVGEEKVLVIDTGANRFAAQTIYGYASSVGRGRRILAINTEQHLDHIGGNGLFRENQLDIYGHYKINRTTADLASMTREYNECIPNLIRRNRNEAEFLFTDAEIYNPNILLKSDTVIQLGRIEAHVIFTPGHTHTNLSVYVPSEEILYCGDCILKSYLPNLESGNIVDWEIWLESLLKLQNLNLSTVVPGHGEILQGSEITKAFDWTRGIIEEAVSSGVAPT
ncbi:MBL fold metallo-hydrolase [Desulfosporosinus orientis]|uniref:MBL fold metallo-hydrolase n=1 Tax=Desulfosporosinus orientis TaxID=1563 RepID=UPI00249DBA16|nr:MBL fold metallo-hydrolase [Desulfosporosinus orientis]